MIPSLSHAACFANPAPSRPALSATGNKSVAAFLPDRCTGLLLLFSLLFWSLMGRLPAEDIAWLEDSVISQAREAVVIINPRQGVAST